MSESESEAAVLDVGPWLRASAWLLGGMLVASGAAWLFLPADAQLPVHWGLDGRPDRFASKRLALLLMPGMTAVTAAIMAAVPYLEPRRSNLARSGMFYGRLWVGSLLLLAVCHAAILGSALGVALEVTRIVAAATGLFLASVGDAFGKSRPNFSAGIRTPWSLSSDLAWEMCHRWTGRALVASGLASAGVALASPNAGILLLLVGTFGSIAVGIGISYVYWKRDPARRERGVP